MASPHESSLEHPLMRAPSEEPRGNGAALAAALSGGDGDGGGFSFGF